MARILHITIKDINGLTSGTHFWCNDLVTAVAACQSIANLSNGQIVGAYLAEPLDITQIPSNTTSNNNVETIKTRAVVRLSGPDPGSVASPRSYCRVTIPAPVGSIINGLTGDPAGALVTPFIGKVLTPSDVTTDKIEKVYYGRR